MNCLKKLMLFFCIGIFVVESVAIDFKNPPLLIRGFKEAVAAVPGVFFGAYMMNSLVYRIRKNWDSEEIFSSIIAIPGSCFSVASEDKRISLCTLAFGILSLYEIGGLWQQWRNK